MPIDLRALALEGGRTRVQELLHELAAIRRAFPDLGDRRTATPHRTATRRRRRAMTAAERKAVGVRMEAYWAARRKSAGEE